MGKWEYSGDLDSFGRDGRNRGQQYDRNPHYGRDGGYDRRDRGFDRRGRDREFDRYDRRESGSGRDMAGEAQQEALFTKYSADLAHRDDPSIIDRYVSDTRGAVEYMGKKQRNILMEAAKLGQLKCVQRLVDNYKAIVDSVDPKTGFTPLFYAAFSGHAYVVQFLLERGANIAAVNKFGESVLDAAKVGGSLPSNLAVVGLLEKRLKKKKNEVEGEGEGEDDSIDEVKTAAVAVGEGLNMHGPVVINTRNVVAVSSLPFLKVVKPAEKSGEDFLYSLLSEGECHTFETVPKQESGEKESKDSGAKGESESKKMVKLASNASKIECDLLKRLLQETNARRTIEVGLAYGTSALLFAAYHVEEKRGGAHIVIDPLQREMWKGIGLLNLRLAGVDRVCGYMEMESAQALPILLSEMGGKVGGSGKEGGEQEQKGSKDADDGIQGQLERRGEMFDVAFIDGVYLTADAKTSFHLVTTHHLRTPHL
mmetsp:Transcript_49857/g.128290  ORF Transcript_49857/g.128290 Transcript_49857/m.128290 type:complete len:481 (-) Transcript_49857:482-1924(-)